ncbi:MAG: enoyl-CoA hydratase [Pseudomonadota bacterium]|nr:enoyl-CoA hydratase [Pseudomonadota bacterium]
MSHDVIKESNDRVVTITISRPKKKNALTLNMYTKLTEFINDACSSSEVRVIHLRGSGDSFTAGNDLNDFMQNPPNDENSPVFQFMKSLLSAEKPIVAEVNGLAIGIGTTLLLHCDLVYSSVNARFQLPFINLGLVPEFASSLMLPLLSGYQRAAEILMIGDQFDAKTAKEIGLINNYFPPDKLSNEVNEVIESLASKPPIALRETKRLMKSNNALISKVIESEGKIFRNQLLGPEVKEAITAFFEKRKPKFN